MTQQQGRRKFRRHPTLGWQYWDFFTDDWRTLSYEAQTYIKTKKDMRDFLKVLFRETRKEVIYAER